MALAERGLGLPTVQLGEMLNGEHPSIEGISRMKIGQYTDEIVRCGFPGLRRYDGGLLRLQLDGYLGG